MKYRTHLSNLINQFNKVVQSINNDLRVTFYKLNVTTDGKKEFKKEKNYKNTAPSEV